MKAHLTTYEELDGFIEEFVEGCLSLVLLRGPGGTGKTQRLAKYVKSGHVDVISGGQITPFDLYCKLYALRDRPVVIDDIDNLWKNPQAIGLLKAVCQTDKVKTLAWNSSKLSSASPSDTQPDEIEEAEKDEDEELSHKEEGKLPPNRFDTRSRVLVIANSWQVRDENLRALMTRGVDIVFDPTSDEIHKEAAKFCDDQEVLDFIGSWKHIARTNFRQYVNAAELNVRNRIPWRKLLLDEWGITEATAFVHRLETDPTWKDRSIKEKVAAFADQNFPEGSSQSRYYEIKKQAFQGRSDRCYIEEPPGLAEERAFIEQKKQDAVEDVESLALVNGGCS